MTGEQIQEHGADGARRARRWLHATCRAEVWWNSTAENHLKHLQFRKMGAEQDSSAPSDWFSLDLGGHFLGADANDAYSAGSLFVAEVKHHSKSGDLGTDYRDFLAKCYCIEQRCPEMYDHFMFITWAPFLVTQWHTIVGAEFLVAALDQDESRRYIALGEAAVQTSIVDAVAQKLLVVVLSDRQEDRLSLQGAELLGVRQALLEMRS